MNYIRNRFKEASTYGALGLLMACIGDLVTQGPSVATLTPVVLGLIAVFVPEARSNAPR